MPGPSAPRHKRARVDSETDDATSTRSVLRRKLSELTPRRAPTPARSTPQPSAPVASTSRQPPRAVTPPPDASLIIAPPSPHSAFDRVLASRHLRSPGSTSAARTPSKRTSTRSLDLSVKSDVDPLTVPLPDHLAALCALHGAVEKALVVHLAMDGTKAAAAISSASDASGDDGTYRVQLPGLISYPALRPIVERGAGRSFGPDSFAQLVSIWQAEDDEGLGFLVSTMRERDRASGRASVVWSLGLELVVRHNAPVAARSLVNAPSSPPQASPSKFGGGTRDGMSLIALWSQSSDARRNEVRRRLGLLVVRAYEVRPWSARRG